MRYLKNLYYISCYFRHQFRMHYLVIHLILPIIILSTELLLMPSTITTVSAITTTSTTVNFDTRCVDGEFQIEGLRSIQQDISAGDFQKALEKLSNLEDCSPIQDLVLYLKGLAFMTTSPLDAERTLEVLLEKCSDASSRTYCSPVILKKARINLIELKLLSNRDSALSELERYVHLYPEDDYAIYLLAYLYAQEGKDALSLYKRLYVKNSSYLRFIDKPINSEILSHEEFQEKVRNLMAEAQYEEAERLVRERLEREKSEAVTYEANINREALMRLLGTIYFRQKRYAEAARVFQDLKEYYFLALSLLRAGKNKEANEVIEKLIRSKDRRVVPVAIAYARSLRDRGEIGASISYLKELLRHFPVDSEQIQWAIAWTYYITGNGEEAKRVFISLRDKYNKPRYEYWLLRAEERFSSLVAKVTVDRHESELKLSQQDNGIYSLLAGYRLQALDRSQALDNGKLEKNPNRLLPITYSLKESDLRALPFMTPPTATYSHIRIKRAHIFMELGHKDEALEELSILINRCLPSVTSPEVEIIRLSGNSEESNSCSDLLPSIGFFYYRTGQYHRAVSLYSRLKSTPSLKDRIDEVLLYPVIYSDYIINASEKYSIDPFLLLAIAREESRYNPEAISPAGAIGLLQIMPSTARRLALEIKKDNGSVGGEVALEAQKWNALLKDPALNIELGAFYLSRLIKRYGVLSYAIAAYNAGEAAVDSWLKNNYSDEDEFIEDIPYGETINYVKRVLTTYEKYLRIYRDRGTRRENQE